MLAIVEDLLDGWPGTLILVTHDRFLMERVTDQQWALLDGHLTHMPGGVDQYLRLCNATAEGEPVGAPSAKTGTFDTGAAAATADKPKASGQPNGLSNAERQKLRREVSSLERKMSALRRPRQQWPRSIPPTTRRSASNRQRSTRLTLPWTSWRWRGSRRAKSSRARSRRE